ncbi:MAG: C1 family peptidase, partial [Opitutales bacterium]|nr:C1 family peptidase [Opitutales bacterium]
TSAYDPSPEAGLLFGHAPPPDACGPFPFANPLPTVCITHPITVNLWIRIKGWRPTIGICLMAAQVAVTWAEPASPVPTLWDLEDRRFTEVRVLSSTPSTVTIHHSGGLTQLRLADLPDALQVALGYDAAQARAHEAAVREQAARAHSQISSRSVSPPRPSPSRPPPARDHLSQAKDTSPTTRALARFGSPPPQIRVDLRPLFREFELVARSQGRRPSCAVFAVVSALEFQRSVQTGVVEKLSEEYLLWATRRQLGLATNRPAASPDADTDDGDTGYTLREVLSALRSYGIARQEDMPNTFGTAQATVREPPPQILADALGRREVFAHQIPGRTPEARIDNLLNALAEGVPVIAALRWPPHRTLRHPLLDAQQPLPNYNHAVTIVGCYSDSGRKEDLRFIFKNSWGLRWGAGGYGFVTYRYMLEHFLEGVILEVR